jgi:hypothetical protein
MLLSLIDFELLSFFDILAGQQKEKAFDHAA